MSKHTQHVDLDQLRGLVHYPYNCGTCMSDNITRGMVTGTYIHDCDARLASAFGPTIRVYGRTYPIDDFVEMIQPTLPTEAD